MKAPRLCVEEYDFSKISERQLPAAFWWEYLRAADDPAYVPKTRMAEIARLTVDALKRTGRPIPIEDSAPPFTSTVYLGWSTGGYRFRVLHAFIDGPWRDAFLSDKPWLSLSREMRNAVAVRFPTVRKAWANRLELNHHHLPYPNTDQYQRLVVWVDWSASDAKIAKDFKQALASNRPYGQQPVKMTDGMHKDLPNPRNALRWLAVWRCLKTCSYTELQTVYGFHRGEPASWRREVAAANYIIKWLYDFDPKHLQELGGVKKRRAATRSS